MGKIKDELLSHTEQLDRGIEQVMGWAPGTIEEHLKPIMDQIYSTDDANPATDLDAALAGPDLTPAEIDHLHLQCILRDITFIKDTLERHIYDHVYLKRALDIEVLNAIYADLERLTKDLA